MCGPLDRVMAGTSTRRRTYDRGQLAQIGRPRAVQVRIVRVALTTCGEVQKARR